MGGVVGILLGSAEQHEHSVAEEADDCAVIFLDDRDHFFKILIEHGDKLCRGELGGERGEAAQVAHKGRDEAGISAEHFALFGMQDIVRNLGRGISFEGGIDL